jgi:HSP20 family protein
MEMVRFPSFGDFPSLFQEMERMRSEMDRLFAGFMGRAPLTAADSGVFPALHVIEESERLLVHAELPGVRPEDIEISIEGNTLTLRGERKMEDVGSVSYHRRERAAGRFQKALTLPVEVNPDAVEAKCEHGMLKLVLPKAEHAKPKKIPVLTGRAADPSAAIVDVSS